MAPREDDKGVTLDLDRSRAPRPFDAGESLWDHELEQISELLRNHQNALTIARREHVQLDKQPMLSIAIQGNHGCGKTSLLKTLVERINQGDDSGSDPVCKAYSLPVLSPGVLPSKPDGQFIYNFLSTLWREIEKTPSQDSNRQSGTLLPLDRDFQRVSEFLQVVHAGNSMETDPWGVSLELLEKHRSSRLLRKELQKLISTFADLKGDYRNQAFLVVMPVDDADLSFDRLWSFLDTYRHYLLHPQLVPVVSFSSVLAEELLRARFAHDIQMPSAGEIVQEETFQHLEALAEIYSPAGMARHLATQFLAKYFPIRSRIRLQLGAVRTRSASYSLIRAKGGKDQDKVGSRSGGVEALLTAASRFFYGPTRWSDDSEAIRWPLQPIMLRRQLQVVDALANALPEESESSDKGFSWRGDVQWYDAFDAGAWALLDIHRDVLEPFGFFIEDMYGWTRQGLTRLLRETVMNLEPVARDALFQPWIEGRRSLRSEVLSLLAVRVTRPPLEGEEVFPGAGGVPVAADREAREKLANELPVSSALLWFLNLWLDVYLPQILVLAYGGGSLPDTATRGQAAATATTLQGDTLRLRRRVPGLLHLEHDGVTDLIYPKAGCDPGSPRHDARLLGALWCDFTCSEAGPLAAISLSRGLRLMRRLLTGFVPRRNPKGEYPDPEVDGYQPEDVERVKRMLCEHLDRALKPRHYQQVLKPIGKDVEEQDEQAARPPRVRFQRWQGDEVEDFAKKLVKWRIDCERSRLVFDDGADWEGSFIRRLHGESLIGDFWHRMNSIYLERPAEGWSAAEVLHRWVGQLLAYWGPENAPAESPRDFFEKCPILEPFASDKLVGAWRRHFKKLEELKSEPMLEQIQSEDFLGQLVMELKKRTDAA